MPTNIMELFWLWKAEVRFTSSLTEIVLNRHYQRIIGLGPEAIPSILGQLEREPVLLFSALESISGVDPVRPEDRGNVSAMRQAWLEWGRREKMI